MARPAAQRVTAPWYDAEEVNDFRVAYGMRYENRGDPRDTAVRADREAMVSSLAARAMRDGGRDMRGHPREPEREAGQ